MTIWIVSVVCADCKQVIATSREDDAQPSTVLNVVEAIAAHKKVTGCHGEVYITRTVEEA